MFGFLEEGEIYYHFFLDLIKDAKKSIHLQTYIFEMDLFGTQVQKELILAAQRGVKVYLLVDEFGSMNLRTHFTKELIDSGVYFCHFNDFRFKLLEHLGRRLHHKILLIDNNRCIVGGINVISSTYGIKGLVPQLDFALGIEGSAVDGLVEYCQSIFSKSYSEKLNFDSSREQIIGPKEQNVELKFLINDWFLRRRQISKLYSWLVETAKKDIVIINSYFFPRRKFMKQLKLAAQRGVRVRLILPKFSDWANYVYASQYLYSYFLKNGIEIYQWKKSILHGKLATIDNSFSTVGSFNLNYTSYQQNLELNVEVSSEQFTKELNHKIEDWITTGCEKIEAKDFVEKATLKEKLLRYSSYLALSLLVNFSISLAFRGARDRSEFQAKVETK